MRTYYTILGLICCMTSCKSVNNGSYASSTPTNGISDVAVYVSRSHQQQIDLARNLADKIKNHGWKIVGTTTMYGANYHTESMKELGRRAGANVVAINIERTEKVRQQVSYGNNYYQYSPFIQPYQAAPPQGGLLSGMIEYEDARRRWAEQDRMRNIQSAPVQDTSWTKEIIFLRRP